MPSSDETPRALTVRQPWASAIVGLPGAGGGPKDVENRTRRTNQRGAVLIHAGLRYDHDAHSTALYRWMCSVRAPREWVFGAVIGTAVIEDCHQCDGSCSEWAVPGAWHWVLGERCALAAPVGARGALGLWRPEAGVLAEVLRQAAEVVS